VSQNTITYYNIIYCSEIIHWTQSVRLSFLECWLITNICSCTCPDLLVLRYIHPNRSILTLVGTNPHYSSDLNNLPKEQLVNPWGLDGLTFNEILSAIWLPAGTSISQCLASKLFFCVLWDSRCGFLFDCCCWTDEGMKCLGFYIYA
jgi:hypothetical protein